jgi:hypothetical protein
VSVKFEIAPAVIRVFARIEWKIVAEFLEEICVLFVSVYQLARRHIPVELSIQSAV